ncbi:MAG: zinc-binding dehydrogenase [Actinomyces sp.]|jgi:L-iditol 2-dehydrogenase|nr:zinc-binding dehydrogenase [Actinomyces sp.]MCI1642502.1 zinc-binding dehydrogenase [Actinomyces sp.]MCI1663065.1 zinc-binding dehydrogenase [Actinomyces sp.]MCI1691703.1 zinc-binding dehydrogenase [Actinomyces sp.]MCI1788630.1 zinc-binding dehydrogenase [Actinomyces sp.]MCI1829732.1 zinc-binding dehydrogenase [Actinomyces sp.]
MTTQDRPRPTTFDAGIRTLEEIPATQDVGVYYGPEDIRLEQRPVPAIGADEVLLRLTASALCGGEAMDWYSGPGKVLGHEGVGVVVAAGPDVEDFSLGQRLFVNHHIGRMSSHQALRGHYTLDPAYKASRLDPGEMARYVRVSARHLETDTQVVPDDIPDDVATTIEPWSCVLGGLKTCGILPGDTVAVVGAGFMGLGFVHLASRLGAGRVVASDFSAWRRGKALELGASEVLDPSDGDTAARLRELNDGLLADVAVVAAPSTATYSAARALVEPGGTLHLGAPGRPGTVWEQDAADAYFQEVTVTSKYSADHRDTHQYLRLLAAGRVDPRPAITHHFPLSRLPEAFALLRAAGESLKIVIHP